jgi:hypothetical protein
MNREDIVRMAQEAGFGNYTFEALSMFEAFTKLVAQHEREACAQMLEAASKTGKIISCTTAAKAIRARGQA